jgi:peroxiredoxin family protein
MELQATEENFLQPKSREEGFVQVLERVGTNSRYKCPHCSHIFSGGNQKIRVHITGIREGGSSVKPCPNPDPEAFSFCSLPRKVSHKRKAGSAAKKSAKKNSSDNHSGSTGQPEAPSDDSEGEQLAVHSIKAVHKLSKQKRSVVFAPSMEAWELLHNVNKIRDLGADNSGSNVNQIEKWLSEYGAEKYEDMALLDRVHWVQLSQSLKVVPCKVFLELFDLQQALLQDLAAQGVRGGPTSSSSATVQSPSAHQQQQEMNQQQSRKRSHVAPTGSPAPVPEPVPVAAQQQELLGVERAQAAAISSFASLPAAAVAHAQGQNQPSAARSSSASTHKTTVSTAAAAPSSGANAAHAAMEVDENDSEYDSEDDED